MHEYALAKPDAVPEYTFAWDAMLYRLQGKIFALLLCNAAHGTLLNLKCDPYLSLVFRERHPAVVMPGWHMNKLHWISLILQGSPSEPLCKELLDISYSLVKAKLPRKRNKKSPGTVLEPEW